MLAFTRWVSARVKLKWVCVTISCGLNAACFWGQSCTEAGCWDQASVLVHEGDWTYAAATFEVMFDGHTVACDSQVVGSGTCDNPRVRVQAEQLADCVETKTKDDVTLTCTPNGKYQYGIFIQGTPARVVVKFTRANGSVEQREFALEYEVTRPNGPDCEPECSNATAEWEL